MRLTYSLTGLRPMYSIAITAKSDLEEYLQRIHQVFEPANTSIKKPGVPSSKLKTLRLAQRVKCSIAKRSNA